MALSDKPSLVVAERERVARDVHASATVMALLLFLWGALALAVVPMRPFAGWSLCQTLVGAIAGVYFLSTRSGPRIGIAVAFGALVVVCALVVNPLRAMAWCARGRPWEAFTMPQLGMLSMALVVPRYLWLGIGLMGLFAGESVFAYLYARHLGLGTLIPATEPYFSIVFGILGLGALLLRDQRRRLERRYIRVQAEADALKRVGPHFSRFRAQLDLFLTALSRELHPPMAAHRDSSTLRRMDSAVGRLVGLNATLGGLLDPKPPPGVDGSSAALPAERDAEHQLLARDAHNGATLFAVMMAASVSVALFKHDVILSDTTYRAATALIALTFAMLIVLGFTRSHPSERRARLIAFIVFATALTITSLNEAHYLTLNRPFSPFVGHKFLMVMVALLAGTRYWSGLALVLLTAANALGLFFWLHLSAHRDLIAMSEPWITLVFAFIGVVFLGMNERRRITSIGLLRAESETAALQRRTALILALRDRLNSPLQILVIGTELLAPEQSPQSQATLRAGLDRLIAVSHELAGLSGLVPSGSVSFDADRELTRQV